MHKRGETAKKKKKERSKPSVSLPPGVGGQRVFSLFNLIS